MPNFCPLILYFLSMKTNNKNVNKLYHRLYFLRRLRMYGVYKKCMFLYNQSVLESVIRYSVSTWCCILFERLQRLLDWMTSIQALYEIYTLNEVKRILKEPLKEASEHLVTNLTDLGTSLCQHQSPCWTWTLYFNEYDSKETITREMPLKRDDNIEINNTFFTAYFKMK